MTFHDRIVRGKELFAGLVAANRMDSKSIYGNVPQSAYERRQAICWACPKYVQPTNQCSVYNEDLSCKHSTPSEVCPLDKWKSAYIGKVNRKTILTGREIEKSKDMLKKWFSGSDLIEVLGLPPEQNKCASCAKQLRYEVIEELFLIELRMCDLATLGEVRAYFIDKTHIGRFVCVSWEDLLMDRKIS